MKAVCRENVAQLVEVAARHKNFVRVDMESSAYTERRLAPGRRYATRRYGAVGAVIQAYLLSQ